jgi:hypothetical protein
MQRNRRCEIEFYLALFDLGRSATDDARQGLRLALESCPVGGIEHLAAEAELSQIDSKK